MAFAIGMLQKLNVELNNVQIYRMELHNKYVVQNCHYVYQMEPYVYQKLIVLHIQQKQHVIMVVWMVFVFSHNQLNKVQTQKLEHVNL